MRTGAIEHGLRRAIRFAIAITIPEQQHIALITATHINASVIAHGEDACILEPGRKGLDGKALRQLQASDALWRRINFVWLEDVSADGHIGAVALLGGSRRGGTQREKKPAK